MLMIKWHIRGVWKKKNHSRASGKDGECLKWARDEGFQRIQEIRDFQESLMNNVTCGQDV